MFKYVKLTTSAGTSWTTAVNGSLKNEEIAAYFYKNYFNVGVFPEEKIEQVTKVEFIQ